MFIIWLIQISKVKRGMKLLGGILLVVGTAIGGGMLALPIATSPAGFINSSLLLFFCWLIMTISAFLLLEVNLWLPRNSHVISMARVTLGPLGQLVAWVTYLLLLYSLLAAYIAGGGDIFKNLLSLIHVTPPESLTLVVFTALFGYVVYHGIRSVDLVNRLLMFFKLGAFVVLVAFISPHVTVDNLRGGEFKTLTMSLTVAIASFGFATIIPSLRIYFHDDIKKLRLVIWAGSLIPLVCYIIWDFAILGVIAREGDHGLISMLHSGRSTSEFVNVLRVLLNRETITTSARFFTSICLLTSFLGVALCLSDFLADGFGMEKVGKNKIIISLATFVPPLLIVIFYPGAFISALSYAGVFCIILLLLFPALMAWFGRYRKKIATGYQVPGGKPLLICMMGLAVVIIINSVIQMVA
jgi:tyrosine-specific transport protein